MSLTNYNLIDSGDGRRLESRTGVLIDRLAPQALWAKDKKFEQLDLVIPATRGHSLFAGKCFRF